MQGPDTSHPLYGGMDFIHFANDIVRRCKITTPTLTLYPPPFQLGESTTIFAKFKCHINILSTVVDMLDPNVPSYDMTKCTTRGWGERQRETAGFSRGL